MADQEDKKRKPLLQTHLSIISFLDRTGTPFNIEIYFEKNKGKWSEDEQKLIRQNFEELVKMGKLKKLEDGTYDWSNGTCKLGNGTYIWGD